MHIIFEDKKIKVSDGESVLDAFMRHAVNAPFSCKAGSCHQCMLQCTEGDIPAAAQRSLSESQKNQGYFLTCQCHPSSDMVLKRPDPKDQITDCMLLSVQRPDDAFVFMQFETARSLDCRAGQTLEIVQASQAPISFAISRVDPDICLIEGTAHFPPDCIKPEWIQNDILGADFQVAGPLDEVIDTDAPPPVTDIKPPSTDATLWTELEDGRKARIILDDFYTEVYADATLSPFFEGVTQQRAADKQYSFMRQLMTGEKIYFGEKPRGAHHWMVITPEIFDHRQALMVRTLKKHGLSENQIARWTRFELHYRNEIVKNKAWPRRIGEHEVPLEGFASEILDSGTVCDYCGQAIEAGEQVSYHLRLGKVSCNQCAPQTLAIP